MGVAEKLRGGLLLSTPAEAPVVGQVHGVFIDP